MLGQLLVPRAEMLVLGWLLVPGAEIRVLGRLLALGADAGVGVIVGFQG